MLSLAEVVDGMGGDFDAGRLPGVSNFWSEPVVPHGDEFYSRFFAKGENVFWSPDTFVGIEGIDDGFPGIDFHDPLEHFWFINLNDEAIEQRRVNGVGSFDKGVELLVDISFAINLGVSDDINIGILLEETEE